MKSKDVKLPKMKLIDDFKAFALKGNVMDMAVGIIIGAAFGKIVSSLVSDIIMPPIGLLVGGVNFADLVVELKKATDLAPAVTWNYGNFIQVVFDFLIVAWAVFMGIKGISALKRNEKTPAVEAPAPPAPPTPNKEELLLTEIRDLLKSQASKK